VEKAVHLLRRQPVEIIGRSQVALAYVPVQEGVGLIQRAEALPLEQLPQFTSDYAHAGRLFASWLFACTAFLVFDSAAAGAGIISADFHGRFLLMFP
jgi:hypothetical protein